MNVYKNDVVAVRKGAHLWRQVTSEELEAWRKSDASKGMTCDGETKLPPRATYRKADGRTYKVVLGRCRAPAKGWGNALPNCAMLADSEGEVWFCHKNDLAVVG